MCFPHIHLYSMLKLLTSSYNLETILQYPTCDKSERILQEKEEREYLSPVAAAAEWCVQHGMQLLCGAIYCLH